MIKFFQFAVINVLLILPAIFTGCSSAKINKAQSETVPASDASMLASKLPRHPRLFFPFGQESEILKSAEKNALMADLIKVLRLEADKALKLPLQTYTSDGNMLHVSRDQIARVLTLSMAYRLFRDDKYAARTEAELLNVCGFVNWSPSHFLDDAEMTTAVAIGYDWCYDYLKPAKREIIEKAILEKAFGPAWPIYEKEGKTAFSRENNWNMVCNSGMMNGALAIADKYPEEADRVIRYAVKYTPNLLVSFAPEGVFNEGPGYWSYNGMYMALFFDNLKRILKKDYGLPDFEGIETTARFYIAQCGPTNESFNFGDASEKVDQSATFFLLARQYKQPDVAAWSRDQIKSALEAYKTRDDFSFPRFFFLSIPWFDDSEAPELPDERLTIFRGVTDMIIINGDKKSDKKRLFLAAKTGRGSWSHNHLDGGSFVLDCDSERWGIEIGSELYSLPDFWDYKPGGVRWNYFRNTNEAHSTISIDNKISNSDGAGDIIKFNKEGSVPFGIFDLSPYYPDQAVSVARGFMLLSPTVVLVRDELVLKPGTRKVSWRFITRAEVQIKGNTAILSQNGKKFYIKCLLSDGFVLKVFPAIPYSQQEKPIKGVSVVEITINASEKLISIPVLLSNKTGGSENNSEVNLQLKDWK